MSEPVSSSAPPPSGWRSVLGRRPWLPLVLPLVVYMVVGTLDPTPDQSGGRMLGLAIPYSAYPLLYTIKIALTLLAVAIVLPGFPRPARRPSWLALGAGAAGVVLWVGLANLGLEARLWKLLGLSSLADLGARPALDPFQRFAGEPYWLGAFLAVRFLGLVVVVPVIEELFLRGFLMRFVMQADWWNVPFGRVNAAAVAVGLIVPALSHPAEILPAVAWFGLGTWVMVRTRSLWDCVAMHAVTNLLLGIYVLVSEQWSLW